MESKNKTNEQTKEKQNHRYREHFDDRQMMGEGLGENVKKVKRLRSKNWLLQNSHRDENTVQGIQSVIL